MSIIHIFIYLIFITLSWISLQQIKFDLFLKQPQSIQSKILYILISIALGYLVASFFIQYLRLSVDIKEIF
jgi:uncharacterized integral membrane protein (TIGR02327 family)